MFGRLRSLAANRTTTAKLTVLEPHVDHFDIHSVDKTPFLIPFRIIGSGMLLLLFLGTWEGLVKDNQTFAMLAASMVMVMGIFYVPGMYLYARFLDRELDTEVEIDSRAELIKYRNGSTNLLFHVSQIESCEMYQNILFPYRLDRITICLSDGPSLTISALIIDPWELSEHLKLPVSSRQRMIDYW
ncbi:MAG: hypothetical protein AAF206_05640 [Bacteroidota bacterium]